jgi:uncharacterized protein YbjQ (UPF0145 family)
MLACAHCAYQFLAKRYNDLAVDQVTRSQQAGILLTTTGGLEGYRITAYVNVISAQTVAGINLIRDALADLRDVFGGRSATLETALTQARQSTLAQLRDLARHAGANAVIGLKIDYETMGSTNGMLMVVATGTAVRVEPVATDPAS